MTIMMSIKNSIITIIKIIEAAQKMLIARPVLIIECYSLYDVISYEGELDSFFLAESMNQKMTKPGTFYEPTLIC